MSPERRMSIKEVTLKKQMRAKRKPKKTEPTNPNKILQSETQFNECRLCPRASAAPARAAIRPWLSLVGRPNHQAATLQRIREANAAQRVRSATAGSSPNAAKEVIVAATPAPRNTDQSPPKRLKTADRMEALRKDSALEATTAVMALGASVHPFTNRTPKVRTAASAAAGSISGKKFCVAAASCASKRHTPSSNLRGGVLYYDGLLTQFLGCRMGDRGL